MNWDNIRVFIAVNRSGSVLKAAATLGMNHSTVLRRLASLESDLKVKLFNRLSTGYEITPAGEELLEQAVQMENDAIVLQRKAASNKKSQSGKLQIALPPYGSLDLLPILARFRQRHPEIELNIDADLQLRDLGKLESEVSIRFTNNPPQHYVGHEVLRIPTKLYVSEGYLSAHKPIKRIQDVQDWLVLHMSTMPDAFENWLREINPKARIALRCNSMPSVVEAVSCDLGVSFLCEHLANEYTNLIELPLTDFNATLNVWILTHQDMRFQPRVKLFIDFMRGQLTQRYPQYVL